MAYLRCGRELDGLRDPLLACLPCPHRLLVDSDSEGSDKRQKEADLNVIKTGPSSKGRKEFGEPLLNLLFDQRRKINKMGGPV